MAPDDPAATGDRSRMERATGRTGMLASERPRPAQAPILFPSGELPVAELQREGGVDRIEAGNARHSVGEIDLRPGPAGIVDERHAERDRSLLGRHAEDERSGVGLRSAKRGPADAERRDDALYAKSQCQVSSSRPPLSCSTTPTPGRLRISSIHWCDAVKFGRTGETSRRWPARSARAPRWVWLDGR